MLMICKIIKIVNIIPKINIFRINNNNTVKGYTWPKKVTISDFALRIKYVVF